MHTILHALKFPFLSTKKNEESLGVTLAFGSLLLQGTYVALAKGLTDVLSPISLLIISEALVACFVIVTIGLLPLMRILFRARGKELFWAFSVGVISSGIAPFLWYKGLQETTAVNASILSAAKIVFALMLCHVILKEGMKKYQIVGSAIVFLGIIFSAVANTSFGLFVGDIYIIAASFVFAFGTVLFKKHLHSLDPEAALFVRAMSGVFFGIVLSAFIAHPYIVEVRAFPMEKFVFLLSFVFFARFLNLTFFYAALDRTSAVKVSLITEATPLSSMVFAFLLLGESIEVHHIIGGLLIVFGLILEEVSAKRQAKVVTELMRSRVNEHHHA